MKKILISSCITVLRWLIIQQSKDSYAVECIGYVIEICQAYIDGGIDDISKL